MAVLMIGEVPTLTQEMYEGMMVPIRPSLLATEGFISHTGGPNPAGGWRVVEVWDSEAASEAWFEVNVKPNLPPGVVANREYSELHTAFTK